MLNRLMGPIFVMSCLFSSQAHASLARLCEDGFFRVQPMDRMSLAVLNLVDGAVKEGGPFADREESKFTVDSKKVHNNIEGMAQIFGNSWRERDKAETGQENVTQTAYVTKMRYRNLVGDERRVKIRFREYLTTDPQDTTLSRATNTSPSPDKEWLEVKIQHPTQSKKVIKVRALIFKSDRRYLVEDSYLAYRERLLSRIAALNRTGPRPILSAEKFDGLVNFLDALSESPRKRHGLFALTKYRRRSFAVQLPVSGMAKPVEIQFTLDDRIQLVRLDDGQRFETYFPDQTVVEVKVPSLYAGFTPENFADVAGLRTVKDFIDWLESQHDTRLPMHKGKLSKIESETSREGDRETGRNAPTFLEDILDD